MNEEYRGLTEESTLTEWEWVGLQQAWNLADGHSHFRLDQGYPETLSAMAETFGAIDPRRQASYESELVADLFDLANQSLPNLRPHLHYSCSTTIDLASKVLRSSGISVIGVLVPTFDNIAQLAQRNGLTLRPIGEKELLGGSAPPAWLDECDAVFLVFPNNPTGWEPSESEVAALFAMLAERKKAAVIDFSFRFYSNLHAWDQYALADSYPDLDWILIEDTGKTWPLAEMKVGVASSSARFHRKMGEVTGELLLNVSPFVLQLLSGVIRADVLRRTVRAKRIVDENRRFLRMLIGARGIEVVHPASATSVEWLRFVDRSGVAAVTKLLDHGVAVLPGAPFFWHNRSLGAQYFRVALARDPEYFADAMQAFTRHLG